MGTKSKDGKRKERSRVEGMLKYARRILNQRIRKPIDKNFETKNWAKFDVHT